MVTVYYPSPGFFRSKAAVWYDYLRRGLADAGYRVVEDRALDAVSYSDLAPRPDGDQWHITALDVEADGRRRRAWYDWADFRPVRNDLADQGPYFKIQLTRRLARANMYPIGQTVSRMRYLDLLPALRRIAETEAPATDVVGLFRATRYDLRTQAVRILNAGPWNVLAGVAPFPRRPSVPQDVSRPLLPYEVHLEALAGARLALALPGVGGYWSWRHIEILGLGGAALITPRYDYLAPPDPDPGPVPPWLTVKDDLSDLAETIARALADEPLRAATAAAGRAYYDRVLAPEAGARYLVETVRNDGQTFTDTKGPG